MFFTLFQQAWKYRIEITLLVQVLARMRKTAQEITREYIHRRIKQKMVHQIFVISVEIVLLVAAYVAYRLNPTIEMRLVASAALWIITLYNLFDLFFVTIPELVQVYKLLKGKRGFALKYVLQISLVTELMEGNLIFLSICIGLGLSSRTWLGSAFGYFGPWNTYFAL